MRMTIILEEEERLALLLMSKENIRQPREQVRFIVRQELISKGYIKDEAIDG